MSVHKDLNLVLFQSSKRLNHLLINTCKKSRRSLVINQIVRSVTTATNEIVLMIKIYVKMFQFSHMTKELNNAPFEDELLTQN